MQYGVMNERGYYGTASNKGKFVPADDALDYALAQCGMSITNPDAPECEEAAAAFEEWYFSGGWIFREGGDQIENPVM